MKKSFLILILAAMQCACSTQPANPMASNTMLSFAEIASEISVEYSKDDDRTVADQAAISGLTDSP